MVRCVHTEASLQSYRLPTVQKIASVLGEACIYIWTLSGVTSGHYLLLELSSPRV